MDAFDLKQLIVQQKASGSLYLEFLNVPSMSLGIYTLPAGGEDTQQPHTEDEIYYVANGSAIIRVDGADSPVSPGSIVFVAANVEHRFHSISEELTVLVFFAPAEYSKQ